MKPSQRHSGRAETRAQIPRLSEGPWLCLSAQPWASDYSSAPITGTGGPWAASHLLPFYLHSTFSLPLMHWTLRVTVWGQPHKS